MAYVRKTVDEYVVFGNYGYGWDEVTSEPTYGEAKKRLMEYRENEPRHLHKIVKRRVKKGVAE